MGATNGVAKHDPKQLGVLRQLLLMKSGEISEKLSRLLAGETLDLSRLLTGGQPGETPVEGLRRFGSLIDERLHALDNGRYGLCGHCKKPIGFPALQEAPWATTCAACGSGGLN